MIMMNRDWKEGHLINYPGVLFNSYDHINCKCTQITHPELFEEPELVCFYSEEAYEEINEEIKRQVEEDEKFDEFLDKGL